MFKLLVCLGIMALGCTAAQAQPPLRLAEGITEISLITGGAFPVSDGLSQVADPGFSLGLGVGIYRSARTSLGGTIVYNSFGLPSEVEQQLESNQDADISITEFNLSLKTLFSEAQQAGYFRLSAGLFRNAISVQSGGTSATISETDVGFGGGLGYQFRGSGRTGGFVEGAIFLDLTDGETTTYFGLRAGVSYFGGAR